MRYEVDKTHALKGAIGQYSKAPEAGEGNKVYGNPDLRFERSNHYILGLESNWTDRWVTDFQVFYKRGYWLIKNDTEDRYANSGRMESRGFEAFIRRNLTARLFGWFTYTYSITRERNDDDEPWYPGTYDQTHVANLVSSYKLTSLWELGGRLKMNTGDTRTPRGNAVYNANLDKYQPRDAGEGINSKRLPTYNEMSLFASREFLANTWKSMLRFGLEYLWYKPQVYGIQYNYDYSKEEEFNGVPVIPYIEYKGEF
jgi:outer membrane receptor protein involved in Fe transport